MNENTIRCFLESAQSGSFSKAADKLFLTRQAVSRQVQYLEQEFKATLFIRGGSRLELTASGKVLYKCFSSFHKELEAATAEIRLIEDGNMGSLSIACPKGVHISDALNPILSQIYDYVNRISIRRFELHDIEEVLDSGEDDVVMTFIYNEDIQKRQLNHCCLATYPLVLVAGREHPGNVPGATAMDFCGSPHIAWQKAGESEDEARHYTLEHCRKLGYTPGDLTVYPDMESANVAVQCGSGVCICSACDELAASSWTTAYPLEGKTELVCLWRADGAKPALARFIEAVNNIHSTPLSTDD